jgi:uncharacterized protein (DUF58 family)
LSVFPTRRALVALGVWTAGSVAVVVWPVFLPVLLGAGGALLILLGWDARLLCRQTAPHVERTVPERAILGRDATLALRVTNRAPQSVQVDAIEELPADLTAQDPVFTGIRVGAHSTAKLPYTVRPSLRGDRPLGRIVLFQRSPLGFLRRRVTAPEGERLPVYPDTRRFLGREALDPRRIRSELGIRPSRRRGEGMDFESLREYVVGDDPRRIDWAATARRGRLVTRLYQHEQNHTIVIAVDASRLMGTSCGPRTKLDHAVDAALALSLAALAHGDRVELVLFDSQVRGHVSPRVHRGELGPLVELLRHAQPRPVEANYERLVSSLAARRRQRALVVVITDFVEATSAGLELPLQVLRRRHRTLLVALRDPLLARIEPGQGHTQPSNLYERLVLDDLQRDRETALARLRRGAVQTLDLPPDRIVAPLLNRYLELRYGSDR